MRDSKSSTWDVPGWPADTWPNDPHMARRILRIYRKELMSCGALARVGRGLIVFGDAYHRWLRSKASKVEGYTLPVNDGRASKRAAEHQA